MSSRGIDIRRYGDALIFAFAWDDGASPPAPLSSGTATLALAEIQSDGSEKTYDWSSNTFKTSGMTSGQSTASLTHQNRIGTADAAIATGTWTVVLSTLTGFTRENRYLLVATHSTGGVQYRQFQYGGAEGDAAVDSSGKTPATTALGDVAGIPAVAAGAVGGLPVLIDPIGGGDGYVPANMLLVHNDPDVAAEFVSLMDEYNSFGSIPANAGSGSALATALNLATLQTSVNNINNLSALANLYGPAQMEIPDSGTTQYPFMLVIRDTSGHLIDLTGSATIAVTNAAGTDRSANLSAVTHASLAVYTFTYGVAAGTTKEALAFAATGTADGSARLAPFVSSVVDEDTITTLLAVKERTDRLPDAPASTTNITAGTITTVTGNVGGNVGGSVASVTAAVTLPSIPANWITAAGINAGALNGKGDWIVAGGSVSNMATYFLTMIETSGSNKRYTVDALSQAPSGGSSGGLSDDQDATLTEARDYAKAAMRAASQG